MSYVFISHVEEDQEIARQIAASLEEAGFKAWFYERDSIPGPSYLTQILDAIQESAAVIVVITVVLCASCSSHAPWSAEPIGQETNLAFVMRNNLLYIPSVTVDGRPGSFIFGSAEAHSVVDPRFGRATSYTVQLNEKQSLKFTAVNADLHGIADVIVGADAFAAVAVSIDYRAGLLTIQREGIHPELMTTYSFDGAPMINVIVDGRKVSAIVDTTSPDTLVLPGAATARRKARIQIADSDLGSVDVRTGGTTIPRIGNRLLSHLLVTIDYSRRIVGLWRDPRI